ncbi:MAG: hypothetical protein ACLPV8_11800 [Steroidobacteraceae bacterium]
MQSKIVALLAPEGCREHALLLRRADGQFALARIDARLGWAARLAGFDSDCVNYSSTPKMRAPKG